MKYSLDTNACIALLNGRPPEVRLVFARAVAAAAEIAVSTVVLFALQYGARKGASARERAAPR